MSGSIAQNPAGWDGTTISVSCGLVDAVVDFLMENGISGVEIRDQDPASCEIIGYLLQGMEIKSVQKKIEEYLDHLKTLNPEEPRGTLSVFHLDDHRWAEAWKESFRPFRVGRHLVVRPSWESYDSSPEDKIVVIDPGMAFGTGQHESTVLCMEALEDLLDEPPREWPSTPPRLLDVGCGTAILALTGVLLGCGRATAVDNDPFAVEAAVENVKLNGLEERISLSLENPDDLPERYEIITANIQLNILVDMAAQLMGRLEDKGVLILSGILTRQVDRLREAYAPLNVRRLRERGEWACVELAAE